MLQIGHHRGERRTFCAIRRRTALASRGARYESRTLEVVEVAREQARAERGGRMAEGRQDVTGAFIGDVGSARLLEQLRECEILFGCDGAQEERTQSVQRVIRARCRAKDLHPLAIWN